MDCTNLLSYIKYIISVIFIWFLIYSCDNFQRRTASGTTPVDSVRTAPTMDHVLHPLNADTITMNIQNGSANVQIYKNADQNIYIKFPSGNYSRLSGMITSLDSTANLRFSQIIMPNGQMDGPFGREITYTLPVRGNYILSIHENQMAGDPWAGVFRVELRLSK